MFEDLFGKLICVAKSFNGLASNLKWKEWWQPVFIDLWLQKLLFLPLIAIRCHSDHLVCSYLVLANCLSICSGDLNNEQLWYSNCPNQSDCWMVSYSCHGLMTNFKSIIQVLFCLADSLNTELKVCYSSHYLNVT